MEKCKHCGLDGLWKIGMANGKQRYRCKHCKKSQVESDSRLKYSDEERKYAISLYAKGSGFRKIERDMSKLFGKRFRHQTIILWVKKAEKDASAILELDKNTSKKN